MATILHIDHNEQSQAMIQAALGGHYNIITATDEPTAIQYCAMIQPDLILMNLSLPDIDGYELATRLKMFMPQTPILMTTDEPPSTVREEILTTPLDQNLLFRTVQSLLSPPLQWHEVAPVLNQQAIQQLETQIQALNQANNRLASLNAIGALIGRSLDLEHLMDEILAQVNKTIDFDSATLLLLKGELLEAAASRGLTEYQRGMNVYPKNPKNSAWQVVAHKLPMIIGDVTHSETWESRPELSRIRSWLGVPLIYKERVVGVLTLDKNEPNAFTDADARYIFTLAYQIATVVENTQLFEEREAQASRLKLVNEMAQEMNTILDVNYLFNILAKTIFERLPYDRVAILAVDRVHALLTLKAIYGHHIQLKVDEYSQPLDYGFIGKVAKGGNPILLNNHVAGDDSILPGNGLPVGSVLIVPIFAGSQVAAVIYVERQPANGFKDQDLWTLTGLARQAGGNLENAQLYHDAVVARSHRLEAIKTISQVVSQGLEVNELLAVVGRNLGQIFRATQITIGLVDGSNIGLELLYPRQAGRVTQKISADKLLGYVINEAKPTLLNDLELADIPLPGRGGEISCTVMIAPLITAGKVIGAIIVESQTPHSFDESGLEVLETLAFQVASAIENARLLKKSREIAIVEERTRLAREMHDGIAQNLAYLLLQVDRGLDLVEPGSRLQTQLEQIGALLKQNIDELRRNIFDLRPVELEGKTLFEALEQFVTEFGRRWNLHTSCVSEKQVPNVSPVIESSLYRILQEALSNAQQHAHCRRLSVTLAVENDQWLRLEVTDDGQGFEPGQSLNQNQRRGLGLTSIQERVDSVGGQLTVTSAPGQGTKLYAQLPLTTREP
jgi:signal transduction histidine kinase/CheY-like chemotaxis protein